MNYNLARSVAPRSIRTRLATFADGQHSFLAEQPSFCAHSFLAGQLALSTTVQVAFAGQLPAV